MTVSPVSGPERRSVLNGKHQVLETDTGEVLERRDDPEAPFFAYLDARSTSYCATSPPTRGSAIAPGS